MVFIRLLPTAFPDWCCGQASYQRNGEKKIRRLCGRSGGSLRFRRGWVETRQRNSRACCVTPQSNGPCSPNPCARALVKERMEQRRLALGSWRWNRTQGGGASGQRVAFCADRAFLLCSERAYRLMCSWSSSKSILMESETLLQANLGNPLSTCSKGLVVGTPLGVAEETQAATNLYHTTSTRSALGTRLGYH